MITIKNLSRGIATLCFLTASYSGLASAEISVSSSDNNCHAPEFTLDDNIATRWTSSENGHWLEYNLGEPYLVDSLDIAFFKGNKRTATIEVQTSVDGNEWQTVFAGEQPGSTLGLQHFDVADSEAQYVRIIGNGNNLNNWNSITEVEISKVEITPLEIENLSLGKETSQSSTGYEGLSSRVVDGDTSGNWSSGTLSHTLNEYQPWLQVDLGDVSYIAQVDLYNRTDSCCSDRLANFYLLVSDSPFESEDLNETLTHAGVDSFYYEQVAPSKVTVDVNSTGRYVRIQLVDTNALSLAEVEVIGIAEEPVEGAFMLPGKVEAEDFSNYYDSESLNRGGEYRAEEGVDIQVTEDSTGAYNVGWTEEGEWLEYPVFISQPGNYTAQVRVATPNSASQLSISIDGRAGVSHTFNSTSGWQSWETHNVDLGELGAGNHTLKMDIVSGGFNFNWLNIVSSDFVTREAATYVGGGGTIAGALSVSCATPDGFTLVDSLPAMIEAMKQSDVKVALAPGSYNINASDVELFTSQTLPGDLSGSTLFSADGNNSEYDFRCANIEFDTALWRQFGGNEVVQLRTVGSNNAINHLTIEDIGEESPTGGALGVIMDGRDNVIEGLIITSRGAQPYGLGDAYGKGAGPVLSHQKHSSVLIRGLRNTFKQSTVFNYSYGHSVFMQGSEDTLIDAIYVQGELRSTADMLAANNPRFTAADERAAGVDFITVWGYKLPTGYWMSLQEAGIRAYNGGQTIIDGVETESRAAHNVTVVNSVTRHTRTGVTLVHATGTKYIENTTSIGCEQGFSIGSGNIVDSYADADVGPVVTFAYSSDSGTTADITILPTDGSKNGWGALAFIGGKNHNITLRSDESTVKTNLEVVVSGDKHSIRHLEDALQNQDQLTLSNSEVNNLTNYPMLINELASGITGQSNGEISGNSNGNNITQN